MGERYGAPGVHGNKRRLNVKVWYMATSAAALLFVSIRLSNEAQTYTVGFLYETAAVHRLPCRYKEIIVCSQLLFTL